MHVTGHRRTIVTIGLSLTVLLGWIVSASPVLAQAREQRDLRVCDRTSVGLTPLTDFGSDLYNGFEGGLYPGGSNEVPADHLALGLEFASQIVPRDAEGIPAADGKVGLISVGVSNAKNHFRRFSDLAPDRYQLSASLVMVNGAQGGKAVEWWRRAESATWTEVDRLLSVAGITGEQVQVAWVMLPEVRVEGTFPEHAIEYQAQLELALRAMYEKYPNLEIAYLSSRNYAGYGQGTSIEPFAYEMAFSVKWIIEKQIKGSDGSIAGVDIPWLRWGPYTWADGLGSDGVPGGIPGRNDGLEWTCDEMSDGIHPSGAGATKVGEMLADHFATDPTSKTWFLADPDAAVAVATTTTTVDPGRNQETTVTTAPTTSTTRAPRDEVAAPIDRNPPIAPSWPVLGGLGAVALIGIGAVLRIRSSRSVT